MAIITSESDKLAKDKSLSALKLLLEHLKETYDLSPEELLGVADSDKPGSGVPLSAFSGTKLSALETIVKYLKEEMSKTYHEIAVILNRDDRTIWSTYHKAMSKMGERLSASKADIIIPYALFSSRENSVLGSITIFLKDSKGYSFKRIADCLCKDYQTIYTTYRREKRK